MTLSAASTCGMEDQPPSAMRRQVGRDRLDVGLAEEEGEAHAEEHQRDADGDVVDARELADPAVEGAERRAGDPGREHARPGRRRLVGDGVGGHGAEDERAFQAEIDAPALLGDALAEADEEEGRRHADGAAEDGERHAPETDAGFLHQRATPLLAAHISG